MQIFFFPRVNNTLGTTLLRSTPFAMLSEKLQTTLHKKNPVENPMQNFLHAHGSTWYRKSLCNAVPEAPLYKYRQHCSIAPDYIAQEKIQAMFSEQHLVTPLINIHQVLHVKKKKKRKRKGEVIFHLLRKSVNELTRTKTAARHSTQQVVKLLVGRYLKK